MSEPAFDVIDGGLMTTVQDAGRPDWTHLGDPESGPADSWSLAVANLLLGNDRGAAALELTLVGPTLAARGPITIALAGADLGARIRGGRRLATGRSHRLGAGDVVEIPGDGRNLPSTGARAYLAVPGGVEVPLVLGSRSTCLAGGFGGLDGRLLRSGDVITPGRGPAAAGPEVVWPDADGAARPDAGAAAPATLRVLAGPEPGLDALVAIDWRVGAAADRVGVRLDGGPLPAGICGEATTHGVPWGAIQAPADGRPIILGADHQSTGGYRVVAVVISADRPVLGQLRPGASLRFVVVDRPAALLALRARRDALTAGAAAVRDAAGWDALVESAGG